MFNAACIHLDWRGEGYFFRSDVLERADADWQRWAAIVDEAKRGQFSATPELFDIFLRTADPLLRFACSRALGDAGSDAALDAVRSYLDQPLSYDPPLEPDDALKLLSALTQRGRLADIGSILRIYDHIVAAPDARIVALYLSLMLEPEPGALAEAPRGRDDITAYCDRAQASAGACARRIGSITVPVFRGEPYHAPRLADMVLQHLGTSDSDSLMQPLLRRRFEAATGIDCRGFYADRVFRPLTAASIVEGFLHSDAPGRFVPGVRYFFGRKIP